MACLIVGSKTIPAQNVSSDSSSQLKAARQFLEAGELYQAKKITENFLKDHPGHAEAVRLMADILDKEVSQYKAVFEEKTDEELVPDEKEARVKTWMERGRSLMEHGEYDEASAAVENVFQYHPQDSKASALLDEIKQRAWKDGKKQISDERVIVDTEVQDRVSIYKEQARAWVQEGKFGAAHLAAQKILILKPDDKEALELLNETKPQKRS